eukprot:c15735_g2_i2 orf=21-257(-)
MHMQPSVAYVGMQADDMCALLCLCPPMQYMHKFFNRGPRWWHTFFQKRKPSQNIFTTLLGLPIHRDAKLGFCLKTMIF